MEATSRNPEGTYGNIIPDVLDDLLDLFLLGSFDEVVGTGALIGSNEIRVVDSREWDHLLHV